MVPKTTWRKTEVVANKTRIVAGILCYISFLFPSGFSPPWLHSISLSLTKSNILLLNFLESPGLELTPSKFSSKWHPQRDSLELTITVPGCVRDEDETWRLPQMRSCVSLRDGRVKNGGIRIWRHGIVGDMTSMKKRAWWLSWCGGVGLSQTFGNKYLGSFVIYMFFFQVLLSSLLIYLEWIISIF